MKVILASDFPTTDASCLAETGKSYAEWFAELDGKGSSLGRREAIQWLYDQTGRGKDTWWATTIWVEYERSKNVVNKKDGLAEGYNICVTKSVKAGAQTVYEAWTEAGKNNWLGSSPAAEAGEYEDDGGNTGSWLRLRPGKDVRIAWKTAGVETPSLLDAAFVEKDGKTGITLNHARIQTREEADGLRLAWGEALTRLKSSLEQ